MPTRTSFSFKFNRNVVPRLSRDEPVRLVLQERAEEVAEEARRLAPVDTGAFRDSITPEVFKERSGFRARVVAYDWKAHFIEYGTIRRPARAPLRRSLERVFGHIRAERTR